MADMRQHSGCTYFEIDGSARPHDRDEWLLVGIVPAAIDIDVKGGLKWSD